MESELHDTGRGEVSVEERNKQLVRRFFDALDRVDRAALEELYAPDFEVWTAGALPFSGTHPRAQALENVPVVLSLFPEGLRFTLLAMTAEGERVAVEAESEGRHVSGRPYHNRYHFLIEIRDGRIRRLKEYMDTKHAYEVFVSDDASR